MASIVYILFRFYEIEDQDRADRISTSTNSQSAVKARDLRSNDKAVLAMKRAYEHFGVCYGGCPVLWKNYSFSALKEFKAKAHHSGVSGE